MKKCCLSLITKCRISELANVRLCVMVVLIEWLDQYCSQFYTTPTSLKDAKYVEQSSEKGQIMHVGATASITNKLVTFSHRATHAAQLSVNVV